MKAPDVAVLLIDVINALSFPGSGALVAAARRAAPRIQALIGAARRAHAPVIYVNDNFGRWSSDFKATVAECTRPEHPGAEVSSLLRPAEGDYFVLKPQHSGFYATPLELLLDHLGASTLVLAGFAANLCIEFTANDAHMRGFHIVVPRDGVASNTQALTNAALNHVRVALGGGTPSARAVRFERLRGRARKPRGQSF